MNNYVVRGGTYSKCDIGNVTIPNISLEPVQDSATQVAEVTRHGLQHEGCLHNDFFSYFGPSINNIV
jgi:hypothetical protein